MASLASLSPDAVSRYSQGKLSFVDFLVEARKSESPSNTIAAAIDALVLNPGTTFDAIPSEKMITLLQTIHENKLLEKPESAKVHAVAQGTLALKALVPPPVDTPRPLHLGALVTELLASTKEAITLEACNTLAATSTGDEPLEITLKAKTPHVAKSLLTIQSTLKKNITSLKIECTTFTSEELMGIISACHSLQSLSVHPTRFLNDLVAEQATWPKELAALSLQGSALSAKGLQQVVNKCQKLQSLDVRGCEELSDLELSALKFSPTLADFVHDAFWKEKKKTTTYEEVQEFVKQNPPTPHALTIAAVALLEHTVPQKIDAERWLKRALEINPKYIPAAHALAELYRTGALDVAQSQKEAVRLVENCLVDFPNHPRIIALKARLLDHARKFEEANQLARAAHNLLPNDPFVLATVAYMEGAEGNSAQSKAASRRALAYNPRSIYAMTSLASLVSHNEAITLLREAIRINFRDQKTLALLGKHLIEDKTQEHIIEGKKLLEEAIKANPDYMPAHFSLAKLYLKGAQVDNEVVVNKDSQMALYHLEESLRINPTDLKLLTTYGELLCTGREGIEIDIPKAIMLLQGAINIDPFNYTALTALSSILMDEIAGDQQDSLFSQQLAERAYREKSGDPFLLWILGDLYTRNDGKCTYDPERGVALLNKVIEGKDYRLNALLSLANHLLYSDTNQAKSLLKDALNIDPEYIVTQTALANVYFMQQDFAKAQDFVTRALAKDPKCPQALILQAKLYLAQDSEELAKANGILDTLLAMKLGVDTRCALVALLSENPKLYIEKRQKALEELKI